MSRRFALYFTIAVFIMALPVASVIVLESDQQPVASINSFNYYTEQFPPCNYQQDGTPAGIAVDLLLEATSRMGSKVSAEQIHVVPWTDAYQAALTEENTVLFSTARLASREASFKWAGPIFTDSYALFTNWDTFAEIQTATDLNGYHIGVIKDSAAITKLTDAGVDETNLVYYTNASDIINDLMDGNLDYWCHAKVVGRTLTEQLTGNYYAFRNAYQLSEYSYYYAFSLDVPDSTVAAFQQAIDAVKTEKDAQGKTVYDQILANYIPTQGATITPEELVAFVHSAYDYAQQNGREMALDEFNDQNGQFIAGELYIFAYDMDGNTLSLPFQPDIIGTNRWDLTDANGTPFIQQLVHTAEAGGGFVRYSYVDPADDYAVKPKVSYVLPVSNGWLVGSGIYEAQK